MYNYLMGKTRKYESDKVGRNEALAANLRNRPNGFIDHRPRKQRTRTGSKQHAIRESFQDSAKLSMRDY